MEDTQQPIKRPFFRHNDPRWDCRNCDKGRYSLLQASGTYKCDRCQHEVEPPVTDFSVYDSIRHTSYEVEVEDRDWDKLNSKVKKIQKHLKSITDILEDVESYNAPESDLPS